MKITVCKEVELTEEQKEIYDKGFENGVKAVHRRDAERYAEHVIVQQQDSKLKTLFIYVGIFSIVIWILMFVINLIRL